MILNSIGPEHIGKKVTCIIHGITIKDGVIGYDGNLFFICQNKTSGYPVSPEKKHGYKYSWGINKGSEKRLIEHPNGVGYVELVEELGEVEFNYEIF